MPDPSSSLNAMGITLQLAAAFGQGAGVMLIEADALRPAYEAYAPHITRAVPFWDTDALTSVSVMRAMGAYAAHLALSDRRFVIVIASSASSRSPTCSSSRRTTHRCMRSERH